MNKFNPPFCPHKSWPVSVGDAPEFVLLKYTELKPSSCVYVKLVPTSKRLPEAAKLLDVVVPVKVGLARGAFVAKSQFTSSFEEVAIGTTCYRRWTWMLCCPPA